jgi:hypothetical protein
MEKARIVELVPFWVGQRASNKGRYVSIFLQRSIRKYGKKVQR